MNYAITTALGFDVLIASRSKARHEFSPFQEHSNIPRRIKIPFTICSRSRPLHFRLCRSFTSPLMSWPLMIARNKRDRSPSPAVPVEASTLIGSNVHLLFGERGRSTLMSNGASMIRVGFRCDANTIGTPCLLYASCTWSKMFVEVRTFKDAKPGRMINGTILPMQHRHPVATGDSGL